MRWGGVTLAAASIRGYELQALALALLSIGAANSIDEGRWPFLDRVVVVVRVGPDHSDYIALHVQIVDAAGQRIATLPPLEGPVFLAPSNRQIFSCESNSISASSDARAFDADGNSAFTFHHPGYLRDCGLTDDQRLYWLHYNVVEQGRARNMVVVLAADGSIVHDSTFLTGKALTFTYGGRDYSLAIPRPELPG